MQLNRKRKIVLAVYFLTLVCLFSYLPMVKSFPCGCQFRYEAWIWEKGPLLFDLSTGRDGKPVQSEWSVDWWRLAPRVSVVSIIALLVFFLIGDEKTGWRAGISNGLNGFAVVLLTAALGLIAAVMIYAKVKGYLPEGPWGQWPGNHGPWHRTFLLPLDHPIRILSTGLIYAFISLSLSAVSSILSLITKPGIIKVLVLAICLISKILSFKFLYWLID